MRHADADAACGCVKQHAFCLNDYMYAECRAFYLSLPQTTSMSMAPNWPGLQRLDDVIIIIHH